MATPKDAGNGTTVEEPVTVDDKDRTAVGDDVEVVEPGVEVAEICWGGVSGGGGSKEGSGEEARGADREFELGGRRRFVVGCRRWGSWYPDRQETVNVLAQSGGGESEWPKRSEWVRQQRTAVKMVRWIE